MAKASSTTSEKGKPAKKGKSTKKWTSRAVMRLIEAGSMTDCSHCDERVKFKAREKHRQVICNVYEQGRWDRVEHYHEKCYVKAKKPYGDPID